MREWLQERLCDTVETGPPFEDDIEASQRLGCAVREHLERLKTIAESIAKACEELAAVGLLRGQATQQRSRAAGCRADDAKSEADRLRIWGRLFE